MRSKNGFTLVSVLIYIVCLLIAMSVVMTLNSFFFSDVITMRGTGEITNQYCKFNMFFVRDMKDAKSLNFTTNGSTVQIVKKNDNNEMIYTNYTFNNECIYRNNVKIAENVTGFTVKDPNNSAQEEKEGIEVFIELSYEEQSLSYTTNYYVGRGY